MATEKIQELADEYDIPTEVVEEYIEYMGFEPDEVDELNYYGSFKNESDFDEQLVDEGIITDLGRYLYMTATDMHLLAGEEADNRIENMDDQEILDETGDSYSPEEIDEAREYLRDNYYVEIHQALEKDAVEYFVENFGYEEQDLAKQSIFRVDYDKLGEDLEYDYNYIEHDGMVYVFNNYARGGMTYRGGGIVTDLNDAYASDDMKAQLKHKMKEGDQIVAFAYTDYGGDFFDKVAIEYFKENHPENIVVERTAYNGQNGIVFGEPASEFLEAYESYLLGYEDMENFYYQMENEETEDGFEFFLRDLNNYSGYKVSDRAMDWLMENKGGHYSVLTTGLDFNSSELEQELLEEGLIKKEDDDDDDDSTDEENYAKGGNVPTIEKRVAEVNALIKEGNEKGVEVIDTSSTWQSPMKYKPFKYYNGVLYEEYEELNLYSYNRGEGTKWETKKYKFTKSGSFGLDDQKGVLNQVARWYRKAIKHFDNYGYAHGGGVGFDQYGNPYGFDNEMDSVYEYHYKEDEKNNPHKVWDKLRGSYVAEFPNRQRAIEYIERNKYGYAHGGMMAKGGMTDEKISDKVSRVNELIRENIVMRDIDGEYEGVKYSPIKFVGGDLIITIMVKEGNKFVKYHTYKVKKSDEGFDEGRMEALNRIEKELKRKKVELFKDGGYMAKGGMTNHGLKTGDKIVGGRMIGTTIRVRNENLDEEARVDLETGKRTILAYDKKSRKFVEKKK